MPYPFNPGGNPPTNQPNYRNFSAEETAKAVETLDALTSTYPNIPLPQDDENFDSEMEIAYDSNTISEANLESDNFPSNTSSTSGESSTTNRNRKRSSNSTSSTPSDDNSNNKKIPKTNSSHILNESIPNNKYDSQCQGPFEVYIQSNPIDNVASSIHPLAVGRILSASSKIDILEIKKIGYSKISVQLTNRDAANQLLTNSALKSKNLTAFIPSFRTTRQGIIRNVPLDVTEEEIIKEVNCPFVISRVRRLNRKAPVPPDSNTSSPEYIPSKTVALTFKGQSLPKYVYLYKVRYEVSPFISKVSLCYSCYRFGHIASQCKGHPRCSHCSEKAHDKDLPCPKINLPPSCVNCKGPHTPNNPTCVERILQNQIRVLAANKNIPFMEAKKIIRGNEKAPQNPQFDYNNFPEFGNSFSSPLDSQSSSSFSPSLFSSPSSRSFSQVTANKPFINNSPSPSPSSSHQPVSSSSSSSRRSSFPNLHSKPPRTFNSSAPSSPPPTSLFIAPNGRFPSPPSNGMAFSHNYSPSQQRQQEELYPPFIQLLNLISIIVEKLSPFLKTLGLYDDIDNYLKSSFTNNYKSHNNDNNEQSGK